MLADLHKGRAHGEVRVFGAVVIGAVRELRDGAIACVTRGVLVGDASDGMKVRDLPSKPHLCATTFNTPTRP